MKLLQSLRSLDGYLRNLSLPMEQDVEFSYVTGQTDAVTRLDKAAGVQVLTARPDCSISFENEDLPDHSMQTVIFVLEKDLGPARTFERETRQYDHLEDIMSKLLDRIVRDCVEERCSVFSGIGLDSITVSPETHIFGGWNGYSAEITFTT